MDVQEYLARIGYRGEMRPTLDVLASLQEAHLTAVPFENLDIHLGNKIVLDLNLLFTKIVLRKRGGFCYELNGLFHRLLREVGFRAVLAMGRVYDRKLESYGPDFDHMLLLAEVDGATWLVDVGFGDFSMRPLPFSPNVPITDRNGEFIIEQHDDEHFRVSRFSAANRRYVPEYLFSPKERSLSDFTDMCLYHQTSSESHFTRQRVCSIATSTGRITLTDDRLIRTDKGVRTESVISNEVEFSRALADHFGLVV